MKEHNANIKHERDKPFLGAGHTIENVGMTVLEAIKYYQQVRELDWMTEVPNGINKKAKVAALWHEYK